MREMVTAQFISILTPYLGMIKTVAIVGGDENDPEIIELQKVISFELKSYGIDNDLDFFIDLNLPNKVSAQYDLVICSQVLEHIYDVKMGIENLSKLMNSEGLLWLACPASNRSHGSPYYFSAGYQPELITNLAKLINLSEVDSGVTGTKRNYFFTHALRVWPNLEELDHPILKYDRNRFKGKKPLKFIRFIRDLPGRIYSCFVSNKICDEAEYATESWVLLKK